MEDPKPQTKGTPDAKYVLFAFRIMAELGLMIAVPVVLLSMAGRALDARYGTKPWLLIVGFALAATISATGVWKNAKKYGDEYQKM